MNAGLKTIELCGNYVKNWLAVLIVVCDSGVTAIVSALCSDRWWWMKVPELSPVMMMWHVGCVWHHR